MSTWMKCALLWSCMVCLGGCPEASEPVAQEAGDMDSAGSLDAGSSDQEDHGDITRTWPDWELEDVQPKSARFGEVYGLDELMVSSDKHLFVALLVGWCPYCRNQAIELERLRTEPLYSERVEFVIVHGATADSEEDRAQMLFLQDGSTPRHGMVMFQDTLGIDAWSMHEGRKDDFFLYAPDGALLEHLPGGEDTNLSTEEGRALVREALEVVGD